MPKRELDEGRAPISWLGGWAYAIPSTARQKDGAWELIRFLVSQRSLAIMLESEYFTYASQGRPFVPRQYPNRAQNEWRLRAVRAEQSEAWSRSSRQAMKQFNDLLTNSRYRPVTPVGQKLWNAQIWAMEDAIFHKKGAQESLDYYTAIVQRDLNLLLDPPKGRPIRSWAWFFWAVRRARGRAVSGTPRSSGGAGWCGHAAQGRLEGGRTAYFRAAVARRRGLRAAVADRLRRVHRRPAPVLDHHQLLPVRRPEPGGLHGPAQLRRSCSRGDELFWKSLYNTVFMVRRHPAGHGAGPGHRAAAEPQGARRGGLADVLLPAEHRARRGVEHPVDLDLQPAERPAERDAGRASGSRARTGCRTSTRASGR